MKSFKNPVDLNLQERLCLLLHNSDLITGYYDYSKITSNRANIRKLGWDLHRYNKFEAKELLKKELKTLEKFVALWDRLHDTDPQWCFVSGWYIPPRFRGNLAIKPFKNGEWCYKEKYDRYLNHNVVSERLTEKSQLICIATKPNYPRDFTIRPLVENNEQAIRKHIRANPHGFSEDDRCENIGDWKDIRNRYFLKPNGKPFPRMRVKK